jgi:hypothetical protein
MTTTSTVPGPRIGKLAEELFKLSGNPYSQVRVKQIEGIVKKGRFSVERARLEVKVAEYFLKNESGSSEVLSEFTGAALTGAAISQMTSLSPYRLGLVDRDENKLHRHSFIYYRILDGEKFSKYDEKKLSAYKEKVLTYIDLMNQFIGEIESWERVGYSEN